MSYADSRLGDVLDQVAKKQSAPGGGAVAAITASFAASLVAMAARYSTGRVEGSADVVTEAESMRLRAADLADEDARAYEAVIAARSGAGDDSPGGRSHLHAALGRATAVPLEVAELAARTAQLAAPLAVDGTPDLRGDAMAAVLLAEAACRSAAHLVAVNVDAAGGDTGLVRRAETYVGTARDAVASTG